MSVEFRYILDHESEQYSYYRIPKLLFTDNRFKGLSTDAKVLYGLMLDRVGLSIKNGWKDDKHRIFIYFTIDDVMQQLNCHSEKATRLISELGQEKGIGLIERVRQGQGRPTIIYVKHFTC